MKTFIVDAFTDVAFAGNPAGVCLVHSPLSDEKMLHVAQELGLSETAFIEPLASHHTFSIRYFSPRMEIPLCGHATLASAKVAMATYQAQEVAFITSQNLTLPATESDGQIVIQFPIYSTQPADAPVELLAALGLSAIKNAAYNEETRILLLEIAETAELAALAPDFSALIGHTTRLTVS